MQSGIPNSVFSSVSPSVHGFNIQYSFGLGFPYLQNEGFLNCLTWLLSNKQLYTGYWFRVKGSAVSKITLAPIWKIDWRGPGWKQTGEEVSVVVQA